MNIFDTFVLWFAQTSFYTKYVSQWPAPLNNVSFDAAILVIAIVFGVKAVYDSISSYRFHQRLKAKQRMLEEQNLDKELRDAKKADTNELMDQYMKFMMMAQMQNMTSVMGLSFDQWKDMKNGIEEKQVPKVEAKQKTEVSVEKKKVKIPVPSFEFEKKQKPKKEPVPVPTGPDPSLIDELTGLWNRRAYNQAFERVSQKNIGVVYLDVNNLKQTNDTIGHKYGDRLIVATAEALKKAFPECAYRTGGDEFIVLLDGVGPASIEKKLQIVETFLKECRDGDFDGLEYEVAKGYAVGDGIMTKRDVEEAAESEMYKNKKALKEAKQTVEPEIIEEVPVVEENTEPYADADGYLEVIEEEIVKETSDTEVIEEAKEVYDEGYSEEDFLQPSELVDVDFEEYVQEPEAIEEIEPEEDDAAEEEIQLIDYHSILEEKEAEEQPTFTQTENDFMSILNSLNNQKAEELAMKELEEEANKAKEKNMATLTKKVKSNLRVEGLEESEVDTERETAIQSDFDKRRAAVLQKEAKEAEREAKRQRKLEEKEAKRRARNQKGSKATAEEDCKDE